MTSVRAFSADAVERKATVGGRIAFHVSMLMAVGCAVLLAFWIWRGVLGIPYDLYPMAITLDGGIERVRPWAPVWVPLLITGLLAAVMWRPVLRRVELRGLETVPKWRAARLMVLISLLAFFTSFICLSYGAVLQYDPRPSLWQMISIFPMIALEALAMTIVNCVFHGLIMVPAAALLGSLLAVLTNVLGRVLG